METKPLDFNGVLLQEIRQLQTGLAQIATENQHILKGMARIEARIEKMEARDDTHQQAIEGLRLDVHRQDAALTATSGTALDTQRRAQMLERQYQGLSDSYMQINRRTLAIEKRIDAQAETMTTMKAQCEGAMDTLLERAEAVLREWEPWLKGIRWVLVGVLAVGVGALALWLFKDLAASILAGGI